MTTRRLKEWARDHITAIRWTVVIIMLAIGTWGLVLGARHAAPQYAIADTRWGRDLGYFLVNLGPELAGIVIGVVVIDALNDWRQDEQLKVQLILQMGSRHNDVTDTAVRALGARRWLYDGSLKGAILWVANLEEAPLEGANLEEANLEVANLERARLEGANLQGANLKGANLQGARLVGANLQGARLEWANLQGARLEWANLERATLNKANLERARLWATIMPDGIEIRGLGNPEGPTYEEWLAMPDNLQEEEE